MDTATVLTAEELTGRLRQGTGGMPAAQASVELLVRHGNWLPRADFQSHVQIGFAMSGSSWARVDWEAAVTALNSGLLTLSAATDARILRLCAAIATGIPLNIRDALRNLSPQHAQLALSALWHSEYGSKYGQFTISSLTVG